jgi:hypothetical protein
MAASPQVPLSGTGSAQTGAFTPSGAGDVTQAEFPAGDNEAGPDPYNGTISFSTGAGGGPSVSSGQKAKSNPVFNFGFQGLNHYQQRYSRGGNQFSVEPPDQGMCVGNGDVVEVVNDVFNVYSAATGASLLPDNTATNIVAGSPRNVDNAVDLNSFYGYAPAINRSTGVRGEFVTDASCMFDAQTQRFFVVALTLDPQVSGPCQGVFSCVNHLDLAVSQTSDPGGQLEHLPDRCHQRRHEYRWQEPGPVSRRLPAHGRRRERDLPHGQLVSVARQRVQRGADLRAVEGAACRGCPERGGAAHRHLRHG